MQQSLSGSVFVTEATRFQLLGNAFQVHRDFGKDFLAFRLLQSKAL